MYSTDFLISKSISQSIMSWNWQHMIVWQLIKWKLIIEYLTLIN